MAMHFHSKVTCMHGCSGFRRPRRRRGGAAPRFARGRWLPAAARGRAAGGAAVTSMRATLLLQHAALILAVCCADASQRAAAGGAGFCASFRPLPPAVVTHLEATVGQTVYRMRSFGPFVRV